MAQNRRLSSASYDTSASDHSREISSRMTNKEAELFYIVMEYCAGGDLNERMKAQKGKGFEEHQRSKNTEEGSPSSAAHNPLISWEVDRDDLINEEPALELLRGTPTHGTGPGKGTRSYPPGVCCNRPWGVKQVSLSPGEYQVHLGGTTNGMSRSSSLSDATA
ncbi:putative serine threonine kinase-like protein [Labeo rohita]|uniref:Putative serine threonine kinase-like protein n=1 Tax=Labeo rohita TaxID=84645 RepID=A0A498M5A6_LABRO|nr:putative serine threonine kinase-like protein [Labeo rohita]